MEILIYDKFSNLAIAPHLWLAEIDCKCDYEDCKRTLFNSRTLTKYNLLRKYFAKVILVGSGYRCQRHNKDIGGTSKSYHMLGSAIDLQPEELEDLDKLEEMAKQYFDVVIRYDDFIHCHMLT